MSHLAKNYVLQEAVAQFGYALDGGINKQIDYEIFMIYDNEDGSEYYGYDNGAEWVLCDSLGDAVGGVMYEMGYATDAWQGVN